jgi:hypothetical protein
MTGGGAFNAAITEGESMSGRFGFSPRSAGERPVWRHGGGGQTAAVAGCVSKKEAFRWDWAVWAEKAEWN